MPSPWLLWYIAPSFLQPWQSRLYWEVSPKSGRTQVSLKIIWSENTWYHRKHQHYFSCFQVCRNKWELFACIQTVWSDDTCHLLNGPNLGSFSAAPGTGPWEDTQTACHWAICWELVRETKELFLPWENAESSNPTFFIGAHQFSWHFQEKVSLMKDRKQRLFLFWGRAESWRKQMGKRGFNPYSIHWPSNVRASSSFALPDPEQGLDLLSCVLWANTCMLQNSWRGQGGRCLSLHNFCKMCLKRPGFVPCQNSSSDTLQTSVHEESALLARSMVAFSYTTSFQLTRQQWHLCHTPGSHPYKDKIPWGKMFALFSGQSTTFFLVQKLSSLWGKLCHAGMEQALGCESTGFLRATPIDPAGGSGPLEHSKDAPAPALSPFWNKPTEALQVLILTCQKRVKLLLQYPPGTWTLLFRATLFPRQVWPCLVGPCCWVKCIFCWHTDAFVQLALLFSRGHPQPCSSHSEHSSFLVPLKVWPFLVYVHQSSIQKGPDVYFFRWARLWQSRKPPLVWQLCSPNR